MVICLERGADLHMTQLMPLPLTVSCFSKIQIVCVCEGYLSNCIAGILECFQGFNNDFKEAMDQVDQDYLKEILKTTSSGFSELTDVNVQDDGTTYEQVLVFHPSYVVTTVSVSDIAV